MRSLLSLLLSLCLSVSLVAPPAFAAVTATPGSLIKLVCPSNAGADHLCKAVYFYGHDGKRHAFPHSKVYATWYADFSGVQTVSATLLASIPLGANVTYRPGSALVKFSSLNTVYAVAFGGTLRWVKTEEAAKNLYGPAWNTQVQDINDAFYADYDFGADISTGADYNLAGERTATPTIDESLDSITKTSRVTTARGSFDVTLIQLQREKFRMITDTASASDCTDACPVKSLADFATANAATIGIHGSYFCPPDYADCAGKVNTFLAPFFNSGTHTMINAGSLAVHEGPMIAVTTDGQYFFYHRTKEFGPSVASFEAAHHTTLAAAVSNYPSLLENGIVVVENEKRLDDAQRTVPSVRGAIGFNDHFVFLVVARAATVVDLASIMQTLGATNALNLDGGGSTALLYNNISLAGPGRLLPNAILFKP